jgi:hypothetical protein
LERRGRINAAQLDRLFEIEKGLYKTYTEKDLVPPNISQVWHPGRFTYPESMLDRSTRLKAEMDAGLKSYVRAVRDMYDLSTDDDAIDFIEKMREQDEQYKAPASQPQTGIGQLLQKLPPRPPKKII